MLTFLAACLAKNTGWNEDYILKMPFFKVLLYTHIYNILNGAITDWASVDASEKPITVEEVKSYLDEL